MDKVSIMYYDPDDDDNQFKWWLGELGSYLLEMYNFNIIEILAKNPEVAAKSAQLLKEEFMKGTDPQTFGDAIVPKNYRKEVDEKT